MLVVSAQLLIAFVLVFARVGGVVAFLPFPGTSLFPPTAKAGLAVVLTILLLPLASVQGVAMAGFWTVSAWVLREAGFGIAVGLAFDLLSEMLGLAAQILGFQAGYSYINTVDPSTLVDATILNVLLTLLGGLLFFSFDLHLELVRALARSFEVVPAGQFAPGPGHALSAMRLGSAVFETAVRVAFPIVAVLLLLDLALALLSYVNARMQLLTLAFTLKMLVTLVSLYAAARVVPQLYHELARRALGTMWALASGGR
jgi:flagellar biosynthetic protein FliR